MAGWISILRIGTCWDEEVYREIGLGMSDDRLMNHKLHIILTFITFGMWWPFYLGLYLYYKFSDSTIESRLERRGRKKEHLEKRKLVKSSKEVGKSEFSKENWRELFERDLGKQRAVSTSSSKPRSRGYKQGKTGFWNQSHAYILACGHQIRATKMTGTYSQGLLNKTVWCDICNADRIVTGTLDPWRF